MKEGNAILEMGKGRGDRMGRSVNAGPSPDTSGLCVLK